MSVDVEALIERLERKTQLNPFRTRNKLLPDVADPLCTSAAQALRTLSTQLAERDRELEEARAEAAIERSVGQQQLEALDGALRIALWNECRGRGMSQDASLLHIRDRMSAFLDSKEKNDG